eukprot:gene8674-biopygen8535
MSAGSGTEFRAESGFKPPKLNTNTNHVTCRCVNPAARRSLSVVNAARCTPNWRSASLAPARIPPARAMRMRWDLVSIRSVPSTKARAPSWC